MAAPRAAFALCLVAVCLLPGRAAVHLTVANQGRHTVWRQSEGQAVVFTELGQPGAKHDFGPGLLDLSGSPDSTRVAALVTDDRGQAIVVWDYLTNTLREAPQAEVAAATGACWSADGRSLLIARPDLGGLKLLGSFLDGDWFVAAPGLTTGGGVAAVATSLLGDFVALGNSDAVYLGDHQSLGLTRHAVALGSANAPLGLRFSADGRELLAGGDQQLVRLKTSGGALAQVPLGSVTSSAAFDFSSTGRSFYLAEAARLLRLRTSDGKLEASFGIRTTPARPLEAATLTARGAVAIAYDDGKIAWSLPGEKRVIGPYPGVAGVPPLVIEPSAANQPVAQAGPRADTDSAVPMPEPPQPTAQVPTAEALVAGAGAVLAAGSKLVSVQPGAALILLDGEFHRLTALEALAAQRGLASAAAALVAVWLARADLMPPEWRGETAALAGCELAELRGVNPLLTPTEWADRLGGWAATTINQRGADGLSRPARRFGAFLLATEPDNTAFGPGATLRLSADQVRPLVPAPPAPASPTPAPADAAPAVEPASPAPPA